MKTDHFGFTPAELRKLRSMKNPYGIQKFLDAMPYHLEDTAWSPRKVLAEESSHCLEGAIFGAAALRANGYPPLLLDFEADHDTDHVIAIYRERGCWGAVAKSNYTGCRWREPVYRTLRELALSYFNIYFNLRRERTLRRYSVPVNLKRASPCSRLPLGAKVLSVARPDKRLRWNLPAARTLTVFASLPALSK